MKMGIIGLGNMGSAMAHGLLNNNIETFLYDKNKDKRDEFQGFDKANIVESEVDVVKNADAVILTVKPYAYDELLDKIKENVKNQIIISVTSSYDLKKLEEKLSGKKLLMAMPNTPAKILNSMTGICPGENISDEELSELRKIFSSFGETEIVEEKNIKIYEAVCGCMPAYVYMYIEAAADAAVSYGMKRDVAYKVISQAVAGSANMVRVSGLHPGELKDQVTTPGGTTIKGLKSLEKDGFRSAIINAVDSIMNK
ncbi:MAG: pyrroline-5-carboxylate reductase [Peptoniphilus sp.]|uniref:pyrroline-5-carboxylate reductase n=1 Tax=Peptoniphilus sp. TaxID=1971214 RepID=UPI0025E3F4F7|nr:pyrroline-5-carboxylate reductase [Peptoniphilus sp.]MCI5643575.1 pyrroline-5-carboxylate reductase [Peptoniphilus sp.]MDD7353327.1 pyrroline-5-carboxylate reductase [Peptoniphilaceae bacterium]MDY3903526.1 pyrroline-5-carboxylate reductase [Peptoniphilus sp.]